jgi:hypothetical protein
MMTHHGVAHLDIHTDVCKLLYFATLVVNSLASDALH